MKFIKILILTFSLSLLFLSCSDDDENISGTGSKKDQKTVCTVSGGTFSSTSFDDPILLLEMTALNYVYVQNSDYTLYRYTIDVTSGCALTLDASFGTAGVFTFDSLYQSEIHDIHEIDKDNFIMLHDDEGYTRYTSGTITTICNPSSITHGKISPDGNTGFHGFLDVDKMDLSDTSCTETSFSSGTGIGDSLSSMRTIGLDASTIYIAGTAAVTDNDAIYSFDYSGTVKTSFDVSTDPFAKKRILLG